MYVADVGRHQVLALDDGELRVVAGSGADGSAGDTGLVDPEDEAAGVEAPAATDVALDRPAAVAVVGDDVYVGAVAGTVLRVTDDELEARRLLAVASGANSPACTR